jgi:hypothetical protein
MPIATTAGAIVAAGALSAGASVAGSAAQSGAINASSKSAARAAEEARIINQQNLTNTLGAVGPRLETAGDRSNAAILAGDATATAALQPGYAGANARLQEAGGTADMRLAGAQGIVSGGVTRANALLDPYVQQGGRALGMVGDLSGANGVDAGRAAMGNFQYSPAYQFNLEQGLRGVDASASSRGMLTSGSTMAGAMKYASGLASNEFANYYNRLNDLAKTGYTASQQSGANTILGAGQVAGYEADRGKTALGVAGSMAGNDINLAGAISNNAMTTGGRLATNEQTTAGNIQNLYTGNASQQAANLTNATNNMAQTATSAATAQANIAGNAASGVGSAINSGMNNYMLMNALAPQGGNYNVTNANAVYAPGQQTLQTAPVAVDAGIKWSS